MMQFDVFPNPVTRARGSYPFVVVLQADVAQDGPERAVAPVAPRSAVTAMAGRLTPIMTIEHDEFVLLVPSLTTIPAQDLNRAVSSLAARRHDILAAIDYLFFGV